MRRRQPPSAGFTLIEMVVAIVVSAVVIGFAAMFMTAPVEAYFAQSRRTQLVQDSGEAPRQLREDLRRALPNSVRVRVVGTRTVIEMLRVERDFFYNAEGEASGADERELKTSAADQRFAVFPPVAALPSTALYAVVGNLGTGGAATDAYRFTAVASTGVIAALDNSMTADALNKESQLRLTKSFKFTAPGSPIRRLFLVSGPVTYICNTASNAASLNRYSGYAIRASQWTTDAQLVAAGAVRETIVDNVAACAVRCWVGATPCKAGVVLDMQMRRSASGGDDRTHVFAQIPLDDRS